MVTPNNGNADGGSRALTIHVPGDLANYDIRTETPRMVLEDMQAIRNDPNATPEQLAAAGEVLRRFSNMIAKGVRIDLVICLDITGSMAGEIEGCKAAIRGLMEYVRKSLEADRKRWPLDVRVALILFRDLENDSTEVLRVLDSTADLALVEQVLEKTYVDGGGNNPGESGLEALAIAIGDPKLSGRIPQQYVANLQPTDDISFAERQGDLYMRVAGDMQGMRAITHREGVPTIIFLITDEPALERTMKGLDHPERVYFTVPEIKEALDKSGFSLTAIAKEHYGMDRSWKPLTQDVISIDAIRSDVLTGRFGARYDSMKLLSVGSDDTGPMTRVIDTAVSESLTATVKTVAVAAQEQVLMLTSGSTPTVATGPKGPKASDVIALG